MKRLVLVVTAILVLFLGIMSCTPVAQTDIQTDTPITEPEPEETQLDMHWIAYRVWVISGDLDDLFNKYPLHYFPDYPDGELSLWVASGLSTPMGRFSEHFSVADIESARPHIANASSLLNRGCLPTEQVSREVSPEEIAHELEASMSLLQKQVEDTYTKQSSCIAWIEDFNNWWIQEYGKSHSWWQLSEENKEIAIIRHIEFFDEYREDLSRLISEHELILSRMD